MPREAFALPPPIPHPFLKDTRIELQSRRNWDGWRRKVRKNIFLGFFLHLSLSLYLFSLCQDPVIIAADYEQLCRPASFDYLSIVVVIEIILLVLTISKVERDDQYCTDVQSKRKQRLRYFSWCMTS